MATITLTAVPACFEQHPKRSYTMKVTELLGTCLGRRDSEAKSLDDIRMLVRYYVAPATRAQPHTMRPVTP